MPSACTQRTLRLLREDFQFVEVTERWCNFSQRRKDLFKFGDIIAIGSKGAILVQSTSGTNHVARRKKILRIPAAKAWLKSCGQIWIVSWNKKGARGKLKRWTPRIEYMKLEDFK